MNTQSRRPVAAFGFAALALFALALFAFGVRPSASAPTQAVVAAPPPGREQATFAAGCFWSMEAIFKQLKGVDSVQPGYAGGTAPHPSYEFVETGTTGYAETVNITFDPKVITYRDLVHVLLTVRNPTTPDKQGPDEGPQYRSVVWTRSAAQKAAAQAEIARVNTSHLWKAPIVTEVRPLLTFWQAEGYHVNYYNLHPHQPYCAFVIAPEIADFRAQYKSKLKG